MLHGVWIAPILVGAGMLALAVLRHAAPAARYGVALAVLAAVAVVPWGIGGYVYLEYAEHLDWVARNTAGRTPHELHALHYGIYVPPLSGGTAGALEALAVGAALFWLMISLRGLVALGREGLALKRTLARIADCADEGRRRLLERLRAALAIGRPVRLVVVPSLAVPFVSGVSRPVVLLPGLAAAEHDEAALAHELAHVRRGDVLTNLVQRLLEATTCFNPARALLSRRIEREREVAADLLACSALPGRRGTYVRALMALEQRRKRADDLELSLDGSGDLVGRIRAVASPPLGHPSAARLLLLVAGLVWAAWLVSDSAIRPAVRGSVELVMERDLSTRIVDVFPRIDLGQRTAGDDPTPASPAGRPRPTSPPRRRGARYASGGAPATSGRWPVTEYPDMGMSVEPGPPP